MSHILQNSGCKEGSKGEKGAQFPTKFHCSITNPLQVTWTNTAHSNLCSAGADENSDGTEKNRRRKNCLWREQESMQCVHGASLPQLTKKCKVQLRRRNPEGLLVFGKRFIILGVTWGISAHCFLKMLHVKIKVIINCYSVHCRIYQGHQSSVAGTCLLRNVTCSSNFTGWLLLSSNHQHTKARGLPHSQGFTRNPYW